MDFPNLIYWRRKWQPTPVLLPGESHGQGSLAGSGPWGRRESDTTEVTEPEQEQRSSAQVRCFCWLQDATLSCFTSTSLAWSFSSDDLLSSLIAKKKKKGPLSSVQGPFLVCALFLSNHIQPKPLLSLKFFFFPLGFVLFLTFYFILEYSRLTIL